MNFVSRSDCGLRSPTGVTAASGLVGTAGHWNGPTVWHGTIGDHASCLSIWRGIQNFHMDAQGWTDIAYGAGACPHGWVLEGRGPGIRTAANGTNTANGLASAVCYLGGEGDPLTPDGLQAMFDAWLWLTGGDRTGHRDWFNSHCPGDAIYAAYLAGPQEDDLTPEQAQKLNDLHAWMSAEKTAPAVKAANGINTAADIVGTLQSSMKVVFDPDAIADAVVANLPAGDVDAAAVKEAVKQALREGTGP